MKKSDVLNVKIVKLLNPGPNNEFLTGMVHFFSDGEGYPPNPPKVNLSRHGKNPDCWLPISTLEGHNHHAPSFNSAEDMELYINRVITDLKIVAEEI